MADKVSHIFDILMRSVYVVFSDPFGFADHKIRGIGQFFPHIATPSRRSIWMCECLSWGVSVSVARAVVLLGSQVKVDCVKLHHSYAIA